MTRAASADRGSRLPGLERRPGRRVGALGARRRAAARLARRARASRRSTASSCRGASPTGTTCAPGRSPASRPRWKRWPAFARDGGLCSGSATASRSSARQGSSRACSDRTRRSPSSAATYPSSSSERTPRSPRDARSGQTLVIPVKHGDGCYQAPADLPAEQVVLRYAPGENPNGSDEDIAGVVNADGNVLGLMPHPEHAVDTLLGSADGGLILASMVDAARERSYARA